MSYKTNEWLEKYEIKKPDYDLIERNYIGMKDVEFESARFKKQGEFWTAKNSKRKLFAGRKAKLMFVGDITCFEKQIVEAQQGEKYDFTYSFEKVKPVFNQADLVVGNLETMIFPEAPYRTEKYVSEQNFHCNAPVEFLDAIRNAGVDMLTNANNHDLDTGAVGIGETIDFVEKFGFIHTGTFKSDKKRYEIIDVKGIRIAIIAFTTTHNNKECNLTEEGNEFLLNTYSREKADHIIKAARNDGAEAVFVCIHWGRENVTENNEEQTQIAKELIEAGCDCIIGSHPHVLQPFTVIEHAGKTVPVFYSMGNFISHNANNVKARSIIACIDLKKRGGKIDITCSYIPVFTSNRFGDKKYVVLPINEKPEDDGNVTKSYLIKKVLGEELRYSKNISIKEYIENTEQQGTAKAKPGKPNLSKVKDFPVEYDDGKFVYDVYKKHIIVSGFSPAATHLSYSVAEKVLGLPVKEIKEGAFENNQLVKKVNFRKNISFMSSRAFKNCKSLEGVQCNVREVKEEAFYGCSSLSSAAMKKRTKKIGNKAFAECVNLRSVKLPNEVTDIAPDAFDGCKNVVFYCEKGSYAEQYANAHNFTVINMKLD